MSERDDIAAGEYLLGVMDAAENAAFENRLASEPALRSSLADARERFLELDRAVEPAVPSPGLWSRIETGLNRPEAVSSEGAARGETQKQADPTVHRLRPRRSFWSGALFGGALAATIALAAVFLALGPARSPEPAVVAILLDAEDRPGAIVEAYADDSVVVVPLTAVQVPDDKTLQVWTLYDSDVGPVSLGLLPGLQRTRLEGPDLPDPEAQQLYEITLEPAGGSPTGRPTGDILFKGFAERPL